MPENLAECLRLLLVTDSRLVVRPDVVAVCAAAVDGGVTAVQLRAKDVGSAQIMELARALCAVLPVPVIVNDRLDVALAATAGGVHLGCDDLAPRLARAAVRPDFIIGATVGTVDESARGGAADYWGIGPLRPTDTKLDAGNPLDWEGVDALRRLSGGRPCVVIGGVTPTDVPIAMRLGFVGVAVASGIFGSDDPRAAAARYRAGG